MPLWGLQSGRWKHSGGSGRRAGGVFVAIAQYRDLTLHLTSKILTNSPSSPNVSWYQIGQKSLNTYFELLCSPWPLKVKVSCLFFCAHKFGPQEVTEWPWPLTFKIQSVHSLGIVNICATLEWNPSKCSDIRYQVTGVRYEISHHKNGPDRHKNVWTYARWLDRRSEFTEAKIFITKTAVCYYCRLLHMFE